MLVKQQQPITVTRLEYGTDYGTNTIGNPVKIYDQSGKTEIISYDFKGNMQQQHKTLLNNYQTAVDWESTPALESDTFNQNFAYDAMNRPVETTQPDGSVVKYTYNKAGLPESIQSRLRGESNWDGLCYKY